VAKWLVISAAVVVAIILGIFLFASGLTGVSLTAAFTSGGPSRQALANIPQNYLALYIAAARTCPGMPWSVLAGIGTVESDNGQSNLPGVHKGANSAGAEGPMQFLPATFAEYAVKADEQAKVSPYNPADAIYTAAKMLCANGAKSGTPAGIARAIFAYNHSRTYVADVLTWAARYTIPAPTYAVAAAIRFAIGQVGKPYQWGADGPDAFDCSGLVYAAYLSAGIQIARTTFGWRQDGPRVPLADIQPGDLLFSAGSDGTPTNPGHVVMYLGDGLIIQAPQQGQDVQIDPLSLSGVIVATRPADLTPLT
jgi:cell wall-associated NlpC family hydrolase